MPRLLVVAPEMGAGIHLAHLASACGAFEVSVATLDMALLHLREQDRSLPLLVLLCDTRDDRSAMDWLSDVRARWDLVELTVVVIDESGDHLRAAEWLETGASDVVTAPSSELHARLRAQLRLRATFDRLRADTLLDPLTGLLNRSGLAREGERAIRLAERFATPLAAAMMDLDGFKGINDTYGHAIGDRVLRDAARAIAGSLRRSDVAARWGGDEFVLLLPGLARNDASTVLERARQAVRDLHVGGPGDELSVTGGLACLFEDVIPEEPPQALQQLIEMADKEMYRAKQLARRTRTLSLAEARRRRVTRILER